LFFETKEKQNRTKQNKTIHRKTGSAHDEREKRPGTTGKTPSRNPRKKGERSTKETQVSKNLNTRTRLQKRARRVVDRRRRREGVLAQILGPRAPVRGHARRKRGQEERNRRHERDCRRNAHLGRPFARNSRDRGRRNERLVFSLGCDLFRLSIWKDQGGCRFESRCGNAFPFFSKKKKKNKTA
jgi:hypothetical protein